MSRARTALNARMGLLGAIATAILCGSASGQTVESPEWVYQHPGGSWGSEVPSHTKSVAVGLDGTIYAVGRYNDSPIKLLVVAVSPTGEQLWDFTWTNHGQFDIADSVAVDAEGNVYVAAEVDLPGSGRALGVVSLSSTGQFRWDYQWYGEGLWCCFGPEIIVGPDGHVYVTGSYQAPGMNNGQSRVGTMSLTKDGDLRWQKAWIVPGTDNVATGWRITTDDFGNIYVAGRASQRFLVMSYTPEGVERWHFTRRGIVDSHSNEAMGLAVGPDGHIYAAGRLDQPSPGISRVLYVVSLTADGVMRWEDMVQGTAGLADRANALIVGPDGNIYVGGKIVENEPTTVEAMLFLSYTPDGQERWRHLEAFSAIGSAPLAIRTVRGMAADGAGNIYAAGYNYHNGAARYAVVSLNSDGDPRWVHVADAGIAESVVVNGNRVYTVGFMGTGEFDGNKLTVMSFEAQVGSPSCPADFNGDGVLDFFDVQAFLGAFSNQEPEADFNNDGKHDFFDVQAYLNSFADGCP